MAFRSRPDVLALALVALGGAACALSDYDEYGDDDREPGMLGEPISFSAPGPVIVDLEALAVVDPATIAATSRAGAAVYLPQRAAHGVRLEQVMTIAEPNTAVFVHGASPRHGLALVSRYGHMMDLAALELDPERVIDADELRFARARRASERLALGAPSGSRSLAVEQRFELRPGEVLPAVAYAPSRAHGTLFITEFGRDIAVADARDVELEETTVLDSRRYPDRLEMISRLKETFPEIRADEAAAWTGHPYAGLTVQTRWQHESGRSFTDTRGYARGWWEADNYVLVVWPFLIAQEDLGAFSDVQVIVPDHPRYAIDAEARAAWLASLEHHLEDRFHDSPSALAEAARRAQELMWEAHSKSLQLAITRNEDLERERSPAERDFALSFGATAVEYLAAVNVPSDELVIGTFNEVLLPRQVLRGERYDDPRNGLAAAQLFVLNRILDLHRYEVENSYELLALVEGAMASLSANYKHTGYRLLRDAVVDGWGEDIITALLSVFGD